MRYDNVREGRFLSRPNRFIAWVELSGEPVRCHVKNTGRCKELLTEGAAVWVQESGNPARKTRFDLIAVRKGERLINMDAQAPNQAAKEWLAGGNLSLALGGAEREPPVLLKPECRFGNSRFDFYLEGRERTFLEVKGVTLEEDGAVFFPDAPTERGVKHLEELCRCLEAGYRACLLFVIQMEGARCFAPNDRTHPAFGEALRAAKEAGVRILAYDCAVTPESMELRSPVPVVLDREESE